MNRTLLSSDCLFVGDVTTQLHAEQVLFLFPLCSRLSHGNFCLCSKFGSENCSFGGGDLCLRCCFCFLDVFRNQILEILRNE